MEIFLVFIIGCIVGSSLTYYFFKKKNMDSADNQLAENVNQIIESLGVIKDRTSGEGYLLQEISKLTKEYNKWSDIFSQPGKLGTKGEEYLETILSMNKFVKGVHYDIQLRKQNSIGDLKIPDVVIYLPGGGEVVIDAKTPFSHLKEAVNSTDTKEMEEAYSKHKDSIRRAAVSLSKDNYDDILERGPNFVIMFIPDDAIFIQAIERDNELINDALNGFYSPTTGKSSTSVIIASPSILNTALQTIMHLWNEEDQIKNVSVLRDIALNLQGHLREFSASLANIGKNLDGSVSAFNKGVKIFQKDLLSDAEELEMKGYSSGDLVKKPEIIEKKAKKLI